MNNVLFDLLLFKSLYKLRERIILISDMTQNFLFKSSSENSPLKGTGFGRSRDLIPGTFTLKMVPPFLNWLLEGCVLNGHQYHAC